MTACTEKESAEKWCPHARQPTGTGTGWESVSANRDCHAHPMTTCIGSRCMQWRWVETMNLMPIGENPRGYCGLAGIP